MNQIDQFFCIEEDDEKTEKELEMQINKSLRLGDKLKNERDFNKFLYGEMPHKYKTSEKIHTRQGNKPLVSTT